MVYALLPNKPEDTYIKIFYIFKHLQSSSITIDFEVAIEML